MESQEVQLADTVQFYVHLLNRENPEQIETRIVNAEKNLTLQESFTILQESIKLPMNNVEGKLQLDQ